jgi:hypothetical protein
MWDADMKNSMESWSMIWRAALAAFLTAACSGRASGTSAHDLDRAAESYVRVVLALGERDADSLDSYHGPPAWQAEARARHATLADIRTGASSLAESLAAASAPGRDDAVRRMFLVRQLRAIAARIDILQGARPPFAEEARALFGLEGRDGRDGQDGRERRERTARAELERLLPKRGDEATLKGSPYVVFRDLPARYAAFDRRFLIPPDRLPAVLSRAIDGCRAATAVHVALPPGERVVVEYVRDRPWSAFTRYDGQFASRIQVNRALPLTVDRALDLACHEAYPGHHTINALLDARAGGSRAEFLVQPLFSPQSLLHEAASSLAGALAFPDEARIAFERDVLFPLAGLDPEEAERHARIGRLVDQLHGVEADVARRYLDGDLDFPRASAVLERDALMPSADATLKFLNQFRTYAATYTIGRDALSRYLDAHSADHGGRDFQASQNARLKASRSAKADEADDGRWRAYSELVTAPAQMMPSPEPVRK